jgi:hypothetical protein
MDVTLAALLQFYVFSTGRRLFALGEVQKLATEGGHVALVAHCNAALVHDRTTMQKEAVWSTDKTAPQYVPEAKQVDTLVDVALGALRDSLEADVRDAAPGDVLSEKAAKLSQVVFPNGLAAVTNAPFVEQLAEVQRILQCLQSAEWAPVVSDLGLSRRVSRLVDLEKRYGAAIAMTTKSISFGEVKDARTQGQQMLLQAAAMILGLFPSESAADQAGRAKLLGPILRQNEAIRVYLRSRRSVEDVDPDTGLPVPGPSAPDGASGATPTP